MNRRLRAAVEILLRLVLALGLAFAPLAHALNMATLVVPIQAGASGGCPHHAKSAERPASAEQTQAGECCVKKGSACHCAMALALPTAFVATPSAAGSDHPVSAPRLAASLLPAPEPPPPRA